MHWARGLQSMEENKLLNENGICFLFIVICVILLQKNQNCGS